VELYNLKEDIGERNNLADAQPDLAEKMRTRLFDWLVSTKAAFPRPNEAQEK
jgi:hypothetical protein